MQYRPFGRTGFAVSVLGFGAMRLPLRGAGAGDIDEPAAVRMIRTAIDAGVNYVDTAYVYHEGRSEVVVGQALQDGYRPRVKLATKLPSWRVKRADDFDTYLGQQLRRLQTAHIDCYLLHSLDATTWPQLRKLDILTRAERALHDGRIGALGFSFHDQLPLFKAIVDAYPWQFCQIQYNFLDIAYQAGREGLAYAVGRGIPVVVMEPLRGGQLAQDPPPAVTAIWAGSSIRTTPADRALQWLWDQPAVTTVLSGMSTLAQVEQNLASAARSRPDSLAATERMLYRHAKAAYDGIETIPCTQCRYCQPCPHGVDVPRHFERYNETLIFGQREETRRTDRQAIPAAPPAAPCQRCGECEPKCPQRLPIREWLVKVERRLGSRPRGAPAGIERNGRDHP
jgi:uncharacterized protein